MIILFGLIGVIALPTLIGWVGWRMMLAKVARAGVERYYGKADGEKEVL